MKIKRFLYPLFGLATYIPGFRRLMTVTSRMNKARYFITGVLLLPSKLSKRDSAKQYSAISDDDLIASGAFIQSVKVTR